MSLCIVYHEMLIMGISLFTEAIYLNNAMASVDTNQLLSYYTGKDEQSNLFLIEPVSHNA